MAFHLLVEYRFVYFIVRWYFGQIKQPIFSKIVGASSSVEFAETFGGRDAPTFASAEIDRKHSGLFTIWIL